MESHHWFEIVRSDDAGEFFGGKFASVCNKLLIKQEFTPAYSSQCNSVAERGLGLIEEAAMAARIQAKVLFGHVLLPNTCLLYTSPSPRDRQKSRMPSSA